ncbi:hypothetical protein MKX08_009622, partial [Trichoderma sp. CBMAI-0020]
AVLPGLELRGTKKEEAAESHLELLDGLLNSTLSSGCLPNAEVYDAEAVGALKVIKLTKERIRIDLSINKIILFLDNSAVMDGILS